MKEDMDKLDDWLHELIQEAGEEKAPAGFTQRVMAEVSQPQVAPVRRRLPRWLPWQGLVGAAAILVAGVGFAIAIPGAAEPQALPGQEAAHQVLDGAVEAFSGMKITATALASIGAVFALIMVERVMGRRRVES
jgi:mannose/fructose/N-acetylgalactosamine-specific phosphotransferase system component IIC